MTIQIVDECVEGELIIIMYINYSKSLTGALANCMMAGIEL